MRAAIMIRTVPASAITGECEACGLALAFDAFFGPLTWCSTEHRLEIEDELARRRAARWERRPCAWCGVEFTPKVAHQEYCCANHRIAAFRRRKAIAGVQEAI
jgi:hypothetical protein